MKIMPKNAQNTAADSKSGVRNGDSSGVRSGIKTEQISEVTKENSNQAKARKIHALGYSQRSLSTLERLSSVELDFILREQRDPKPDELSKRSIESSKEIVSAYITALEAIKQGRANEPLNKGLKTIAEAQSGALGEYVGANAGGKVGLAMLIFAAIALAIDSFLGFENVKKWFSRDKQPKKSEVKSSEAK